MGNENQKAKENKVLKRREDVVSTTLSTGEGILLDLSSKMYYTLNSTGMRVWNILDGYSLNVLHEFNNEIGDFAESLLEEGLIGLVPQEEFREIVTDESISKELVSSESPKFVRNQPLTKVTAFTAATAGGASFF